MQSPDSKMDFDEAPSITSCTKCNEEIRYQVNLNPVHWIRNNMSNWFRICSDFSSQDPVKQQTAYKDLVSWNSKYPKDIPSGMRCTLNLIKARLQDRMFVAHIVQNRLTDDVDILRNIYMTSIAEFLEILGSMNQYSYGIYPLSRKLNLPDALMDIYHDIHHQEKKPTIEKLRAAAHICIDWLHEHYWINESKMAASWMKLETQVKNDLREMIDILNKFLIHYFNGNRVINSIPDKKVQEYLESRHDVYGISELLMMKKRLVKKKILNEKEISLSLLVLVKDIVDYVKRDSYYNHSTERLAEVLLEDSGFLPSKSLLTVVEPLRDESDLHLPVPFLKVWNAILEFLPQHEFIPVLMEKLLELSNNEKESDEHREKAAIWVKTLASALLAVHCTLENMKKSMGKKSKQEMKIIFDTKMMQMSCNEPEVGYLFLLRPQEVPSLLQQSSNIMRLLLTPNKWTKIYFQSLLNLLDPRLPFQMEILLSELLCLYTNEDIEGFIVEELPIHSTEDINSILMLSSKHMDMGSGDAQAVENTPVPWIHSLEKWGSDPLHHELRILTSDLPGASLWQSG